MKFVDIVTTVGCDNGNKCIKMCHLYKVKIRNVDTLVDGREGENYPIIFLDGYKKISYEKFCNMVMKGEIGK